MTLEQLYPILASVIDEAATSRGFTESAAPPAGAFGRRTTDWQRGTEALRLQWDGQEQWLTFEYRQGSDQMPVLEWTGTLSERYSGDNISDEDVARLRDGLNGVLRSVWARRPKP